MEGARPGRGCVRGRGAATAKELRGRFRNVRVAAHALQPPSKGLGKSTGPGTFRHFSISGRVGGRRVLRGRVHGPQGGTIACLACLEPDEVRGLAGKRRFEALHSWWALRDDLEKAAGPKKI